MKNTSLIITRAIILCVLVSAISISGSCRDTISYDSIKPVVNYSFKTEYGKLLGTNDYIKNLPTANYVSYSFQVMKQTKGERLWERMYNYPSYGLGVNYVDFVNNKQMGEPYSVYGIFEKSIKRNRNFSWDYYVNLGVSFNVNSYNKEENYLNVSFGSKTNLSIGVGSVVKYRIGKYFDVGLGLGFNHFSDGSLKTPNKGLNFFGSHLMLAYNPNFERRFLNFDDGGFYYDKFNSLEFSAFAGKKSVFYRGINRDLLSSPYESFSYEVFGVEALYLRQYSFKSAFGFGVGVTYDGAYNHSMFVDGSGLKQKERFGNRRYLISVLPAYRLIVGDFSVDLQAGYYPFKIKREYDDSRFFQKIALQYRLSSRFFISFGISAFDFHRANYLEWKLGYVVYRKKEIISK